MIDAHHHFWEFNEQEFGWISPEMSVLRADFGPSELRDAIAGTPVEGVVSVQSRTCLSENAAILAHARTNEFILGVVGWLDLAGARSGELLDEYAADPLFKGVREICQGAPDAQFFDSASFDEGLREVTRRDLAYDLLIFQDQIPAATRFVDKHADQRFVVDHCAKPEIRAAQFPQQWANDIHELAKRENVCCKFSGLTTEVRDEGGKWDVDLLEPYFETLLGAFGPTRLMIGSDWPVSLLATSYRQWIDAVEKLTSRLSAQENSAVLVETARAFYRL